MDIPLQELRSYHLKCHRTEDSLTESADIQNLIDLLGMQKHVEGGYFVESDRDMRQITLEAGKFQPAQYLDNAGERRSLSTCIFYLLTPKRSIGAFHRNASRTVHNLHHGQGIYVILKFEDTDQEAKEVQIETFKVGHDLLKGERLQWIVEGGCYKASFLTSEAGKKDDDSSILISEVILPVTLWHADQLWIHEADETQTIVPGFDFKDHDFLKLSTLKDILNTEDSKNLEWLLRESLCSDS